MTGPTESFNKRIGLPSTGVVEAVIAACTTASECPSNTFRSNGDLVFPRDWVNELLQQQTEQRLSTQAREQLSEVGATGYQGLQAARNGDLELAGKHVRAGEALIAANWSNAEAQYLAESIFGAQAAYYYFRCGEDARSLGLLERSFSNDLILERLRAYEVLCMHRVQILNNIMRVHRARERWYDALVLGHALLQHLESPHRGVMRRLTSPWDRGWYESWPSVPRRLIATMHAQLAREQVDLFERALFSGGPELAKVLAWLEDLPVEADHVQADLWIAFQRERVHPSSVDAPCEAAISLLRRGPIPSSPLWRSVAVWTSELLDQLLQAEVAAHWAAQ